MGTLVRCSLALAMVFGLAGGAKAAPVTLDFEAPVVSGPLTGQVGTGTVTYDDSSLSEGFGVFVGDGLEVSFTFQGQDFDETNDVRYLTGASPTLIVLRDNPWQFFYELEDGINGVDFNNDAIVSLTMRGAVGPPSGGSTADFVIPLTAVVIPLPGGLPLLLSALAGLAFLGLRHTRPV